MKVHIAVNVETKQIVAFDVTRECVHDGTRLEGLVEEFSRKVEVKGVIGDGAYDSRGNFNLLDEKGVEPIIKVGRNAVRRLRGCPARRKALTTQRENPDRWRRKYGLRWIAESALLMDEEGLRRVRHGKEARKHGPGDNLEGLPTQPIHWNDKNSLRKGMRKQR